MRFSSSVTSRVVLGSNTPVEVHDTQSGSPPGMAAASLTAESAASCGCPASACQTWWAPRHSTPLTASLHPQTPATAVNVSV